MIRCCNCDKQYEFIPHKGALALPVIVCPHCGCRHTVDFKAVEDTSPLAPTELRLTNAKPVLIAGRFATSGRVALGASDNINITVNKGTNPDIIIAFLIDEEKGPWTATYRCDWKISGGTFAPIAASGGAINWSTNTNLTNGGTVVVGERITTTSLPSGSTWEDQPAEVEGASTTSSFALADEKSTEPQFAINISQAVEGATYEFQIYNATGGSAIGTTTATLTITSDQPTVVLNTADLTEFATATPTLEFTGTDGSGSSVRYNIQIDTVNTFNSQTSIDVGSDAINRSSFHQPLYTYIPLGNPANAGGTITDIEIYVFAAMTDVQVGTFYGSGTDYQARDSEVLGSVGVGLQKFTGLNISIQAGDFIGIYFGGTGYIEAHTSGYDGVYYKSGNQFAAGLQTYALADGDAISLFGYNYIPLLNKVSGTDAGFANTVTPADTDPFNSGEKCDYDVQAGDALADGTYYWRVRGMDPSPGSNAYGSYPATRSFTVVSGGGDRSVSKTEKTTVRDISTVQFNLFNATGTDKATVRDIVSIFLSVIFLSKTDKATIRDIATVVLGELLPITPSDLTEYATTQDVLTIILDVLCPSKTDKATVKDVLTVYFDRWLASKADTATIKDTLAIFLDLLFTSKADAATVRDVLTVLLNKLNIEVVDTVTTQDVLTVILDKFNVSKADTATAKDVLSVILDAFIPSFTDKATIQEIAAVMLDKMLVSNVDTATIQDTFALVFDKLIQHSTENLTVQDIVMLQMNLYNVPGIDRTTLQDISTLILDKLNVPGIDQASVRDVFTLIFDKFLATGIDYATIQDIATLLLWFESYQIGRGDYSTLRDRVLISLSGIAGITIYHIPTIPNLGSFSGRIGGRKHISLG